MSPGATAAGSGRVGGEGGGAGASGGACSAAPAVAAAIGPEEEAGDPTRPVKNTSSSIERSLSSTGGSSSQLRTGFIIVVKSGPEEEDVESDMELLLHNLKPGLEKNRLRRQIIRRR